MADLLTGTHDSQTETLLLRTIALRVLKEIAMGAVALTAALAVIVPILFVVTVLYDRFGIYVVCLVTIVAGAALLFYQAQLRPMRR